MARRPLRIALISPKGPLYRHRGGIWRKSLRYQPLTLTTLASLIPYDLPHELTLIDEGIDDVPDRLDADLVGLTVITGTAPRAYELSARFRARGITTVLGGPHVTLIPDDAQPHADAIVTGYAEDTWPQLLRDFAAGQLRSRYTQSPDLSLANRPFPRRDLLPNNRYLTRHVFEATRGCIHNCDFCVVPAAWGRKPYQKPVSDVVADIRREGSRKLIFVDLNLISDRDYAAELFTALIPLKVQWYGLSTVLLADDLPLLELCARSGCKGLLMGLESISPANLRHSRKGFNSPDAYVDLVTLLHRHGIALQGCFVFGLDDDRPDVFLKTAQFAVDAKIDLPRFAIATPFPGTALHKRLESEGRILTRKWELYDGQHVVFQPRHMTVEQLQLGTEAAWKHAYSYRSIAARLRHSPAPWPVRIGTNLGYRFYAHRLHQFYTCTIIHPCIGRRPGQKYIRTWQMEPLPAATLAGLTPKDVAVRFYDDRMELIPYDEPTDLVAISVETYTAKRAYQIASEYRKRRVPVVMGGFHATLCPEEVAQYAESVVVGEAEDLWQTVLDDFRHNRPEKFYRAARRPSLAALKPDRSIFAGKRYLPVGLVEAGRGCHFRCEFCAVQTVFSATQTRRPVDAILAEVRSARLDRKLFFFVDDNITSNMEQAKEFFRALIPMKVRWVSQASINAAHDEEFLDLLARSGCMGVLIGFESLDPAALKSMNKSFNTMRGGYDVALANLRRHRIRLYGTFIFGYDQDTPDSFTRAVTFAREHAFYIAAFNHLTPLPGTPLYKRLASQNRLLYESWWLDDRYSYNRIPFKPASMSEHDLQRNCLAARRDFYSWRSILRRGVDRVNRSDPFMFRNFYLINALHRADVAGRDHYPLGDMSWQGPLLRAG
jgi:radical SAM superfamily enzyme YgiQ (UPF0313 family)